MPRKKTTRKSSKQPEQDYIDMIFSFKDCNVDVQFLDDTYDEDEQKEIRDVVKHLSHEFSIDKSYVDYKDTKYEKTFMKEQGWIELCKLADKTNLTTRCSKDDSMQLMICYELMILCYLYQCLGDLDYDLDSIKLSMKVKSYFMSKVQIDTVQEWKYYPGKWQTWDQSKFTNSDDVV